MAGAISVVSRDSALGLRQPNVFALALTWEGLNNDQRGTINNTFRGWCETSPGGIYKRLADLNDDICNAFQHLVFLCLGALRQLWIIAPDPGKSYCFLQNMPSLNNNITDIWITLDPEHKSYLEECNKYAPAIIQSPWGGRQGPGVFTHLSGPPQPEGSRQFM